MPQEWFVRRGENEKGPLTSQELRQLVAKGTIVPSDFVRTTDQPDWREAGTIKGLFNEDASARKTPPPLPKSSVLPTAPSIPRRSMPPLPTAPSESTSLAPALWNPFVARAWSIVLTPAFGAFLVSKNWKVLGEEDKAKRSMFWFYGALAFLFFAMVTPDTEKVTAGLRFLGTGLFVIWACTDSEKQVRYVKERFGKDYPRKSWGMPIGIGIGAICMLVMMHGVILLASEGSVGWPFESANVSIVKQGQMDAYPGATVGQLVDNFLASPQWSEGTGENGEKFVNANGEMTFHDKPVEAEIQFIVQGQRFELHAFEMNGIPQNGIIKAALFRKMYDEYRK